MTDEEKAKLSEAMQKVNDAKRLLDSIRLANDLVFSESVRRRILQGYLSANTPDNSTGDLLQAVLESGAGSYNVAKRPDLRIPLVIDGSIIYVGGYTP